MADLAPGPGGEPAGRRYLIQGHLGAGSGGEVFAARDTLLERPVAIKRLPQLAAGGDDAEAAEAAARLLAEARALARLAHPNVVAVFDAFEEEGRLHVVMERVEGPTLRQRLDQRGPLPLDALARLAAHLAAALAHAHGQGIVHRDVKPENVLLAPAAPERPGGGATWTAKLGDFGIAFAPGQARLTLPGLAVGTPAYVAPEQALGQAVDGRTDLYALGCLLYEAATGAPPFAGDDPLLVVSQHLHATPAPPSSRRPDLPAAWDALLLRLLAKRPEDRLPSAAALLAELATLEALAARPPAHNLPAQLSSFVGREHELADLQRLLTGAPGAGDRNAPGADGVRPRLVTLTGPGGTGKTRLALQAAAGLLDAGGVPDGAPFPDGVWLAELAALADQALVPHAVAAAVGVLEQPGRPLMATLAETLRPRRLLLVLDNCEHLVAACAALVETLLRACPDVVILATSREPLGIAGEAQRRVPSLSLPPTTWFAAGVPGQPAAGGPAVERPLPSEAVRLFADRAAAVQPQFAVTHQNAPAVAQLCHRLDGIPLALELAAAWVRVLPVEQLVARLDDRFRLLTGGSRTALERHQTLRAAVDWSYDLLSEAERVLFDRLAVFAGGFTLEAAEAVCAGQGIEADEILDLLSQLVDKSLVLAEGRAEGVARYRLLETLRQYAQERLLAGGDTERLRGRHADCYAALAVLAEPELQGPRPAVWLDRLEEELDNLRGALRWCQAARNAEQGLAMGAALQRFWRYRGRPGEGRERLAALLALAEASGPTAARARALDAAAGLAYQQGDHAAARTLGEESLAIWRSIGDKGGLASALTGLALVALRQGDPAARSLSEASVALCRESGDTSGLAQALYGLGVTLGRTDRAGARPLLEESLGLHRAKGDAFGTSVMLNALAGLARYEGDFAAARPLYEECLAIRQEVGDKRGIAIVLHNLGYVAQHDGDARRAAVRFKESLALFRDVGDRHGIAWCLVGLAGLAAAGGREGQERAARLYGAAEPLRGAGATPLHPPDRADVDRTVAGVRAALGEALFEAAHAAGRATPLEQVTADALEERPLDG